MTKITYPLSYEQAVTYISMNSGTMVQGSEFTNGLVMVNNGFKLGIIDLKDARLNHRFWDITADLEIEEQTFRIIEREEQSMRGEKLITKGYTKHALAKQWLKEEDGEIIASIDVATGVYDKNGDEIIAKLFAESVCDFFTQEETKNNSTVIHFELSNSVENEDAVDVIKAVNTAQKLKQNT